MAIAVALFFLAISCLQLYLVVGSKNNNVRKTAGIFTGISVLLNLIATTGVLFNAIFVILIFPASLFLIVANVKYRSHCNDVASPFENSQGSRTFTHIVRTVHQ